MTSNTGSGTAAFDFSGARVLVTGGSRGIGQAIVDAFVAAGADVASVQRSDRAGDAARVRRIAADLTLPDDVEAVIAQVRAAGGVDVLVNNAGLQAWHDSTDFPLDEFDRILSINLRAVFRLSQALGGDMLRNGAGKIINIASMTSFVGGFRAPAYAASKGAVAQLTKALSNEWAGRGLNVNAIAPGYIDTELNQELKADAARSREVSHRIPAGRWGTPEDIAGAALFLASDAAAYIHGVVLAVDGGWLAR